MATKANVETITIAPPRFAVLAFRLRGTAPYMQLKFSQKALGAMRATQAAGSTAKKGKAREARDFDADFIQAQHISEEGWNGQPAAAYRNALIDACRMAGYAMTRAKMSAFVLADGLDRDDGTPLIRIIGDPPEKTELAVRNATGVADIRVRPQWRQWEVVLRVRYDQDQFTAQDVANLVARAGIQVGIGEGRPFSKNSPGMGLGTFEIVNEEES